jgi:hypothetical protein
MNNVQTCRSYHTPESIRKADLRQSKGDADEFDIATTQVSFIVYLPILNHFLAD